MRTSIILAAFTLLPSVLLSQSAAKTIPSARSGPTLGFALDLSVEMGGDDFLEVLFTNGSSQQLRAGQGGSLAVGGIVRPSDASPLSLRGTAGIKYVTTAAENANIRFTRIPVELVGSYQLPTGLRVGAGVVHHASNKFNGDGFVPDVTFKPATGFTAEIGYKIIALTFTKIDYAVKGGTPLDGGSIGVQLLWTPTRKRR